MNTQKKTMEISCPCCNQIHRYDLTLRTIRVVGFTLRNEMIFTRLFACPIKNVDFEGNIRIYQEPDQRIELIKVDIHQDTVEIKNKPAPKD